ncbi:glycosyltransferase family 2 protein [Catenovulum maritimum]|uniref:glycosyltransferase family 2 protein n=1 Tax=Catenovulum maritimum TaxID=1513271 RepID=UPI00066095CD|nr:glycosyltransferase family A protein [Catenovulum maritimum]
MKQDLISVVIPVHNCAPYLEAAISSIRNQTYQNLEIICVDDGSTDSSLDLLQKISKEDNRVKVFSVDSIGISRTLNLAIENASGDYIARMDADDLSIPSRIQIQKKFLDDNADVDIVGSWLELFGLREEVWYYRQYDEFIKAMMLFRHNGFAHNGILVRKRFYKQFQYKPEFDGVEDLELWTRAIIEKPEVKFANIPQILTKYRIHNTQTSSTQVEHQNRLHRIIIKRYLEFIMGELTRQELELHWKFVLKIKCENQLELTSMGTWISKLFDNFNNRIADPYYCIFERWYRYCKTHNLSQSSEIYKEYSQLNNILEFV